MSVLRAQPLASTAAAQRRPARTNRASQRPRGSTQIAGSSQQSGGVRWSPVVADTQAEVRSGEGKGGGSPARAGRCASLWAVWWKEGAVAVVRRAWHHASWAAAMGTLLGTRRSRGWRTGAPPRARPARGSAAPGRLGAERRSRLRSRCRSWRSGGFGAHGALAAARRSHQRRWRGRALHRHAGGQDSVTTGRGRPPDSANRALSQTCTILWCLRSLLRHMASETGL